MIADTVGGPVLSLSDWRQNVDDEACSFCDTGPASEFDFFMEAFMVGVNNRFEQADDAGMPWDGGYVFQTYEHYELPDSFDWVGSPQAGLRSVVVGSPAEYTSVFCSTARQRVAGGVLPWFGLAWPVTSSRLGWTVLSCDTLKGGESSMGRGRRRLLLQPGTGKPPRVLQSALGPGKPSEDDLLRAYRAISFDMGPGREGGRLYEGRSGKRVVIFGVDIDRDDPGGDGEVIFHGQWKGQR